MLSLAVMAVLSPVRGYSLGLGDLELNSALNQELNAEIKVLSVSIEDTEQLIIKLASRDAFSRAGLDRPHLLQQLKFKIIDRNGVPYVKIFTKTPIREPFLSFLVEVDWPQGHLLREYTLLLDPPVYNSKEASAAASASSSSLNQPAASTVQNQSGSPAQQRAQFTQSGNQGNNRSVTTAASGGGQSARQQAPANQDISGEYRVKNNDTLYVIADNMRQNNTVSVEQMMIALVRKNPNAFIKNNINGVKRGYILRTPTVEESLQFDREQAVAQAREHTALWRQYRQNRMNANDAPASAMATNDSEGAVAQQPVVDGRLSIVSAGGSASDQAGTERNPDAVLENLKQDLAMAREQVESERLEKENLRERLAELEKHVQSIIELKDEKLAKLQQDLQSKQQIPNTADTLQADAKPEKQVPEKQMTDEVALESPKDEMVDESSSELEKTSKSDDIFVDETVPDEPLADDPSESLAGSTESDNTPAFVQNKNKSMIDQLMEDPKLMGVLAGGLAFISILIVLLIKRIRGNKAEENEWSSMGEDTPLDLSDIESSINNDDEDITVKRDIVDMESTSEMMADSDTVLDDTTRIQIPEGQDENTVFNVQEKIAESKDAADEDEDDVIIEANIYLAYGIYPQGEELLTNAIAQHPERNDYRVKLLETYSAAKNTEKFEALAQEVYLKKDDDDEDVDWDAVTAMGKELCPDNALFIDDETIIADFDPDETMSGGLGEAVPGLESADEESTPDFDLGLGDLGLDDLEDKASESNEDVTDDEELDLTDDIQALDDEMLAADQTSSDLAADLDSLEQVEDIGAETSVEGDDVDDDFSLDFDASDLGIDETPIEETVSEEAEMNDIELEEVAMEETSSDDTVLMPENVTDEMGGIDLSGELEDTVLTDESDLDTGEFSIDEESLEDKTVLVDKDTSDDTDNVAADGSDFDISELSEDIDEIGTKLELAKAYIEMGDNEGARSILEEVKSEGNDEQQQKAEVLLQEAS